MLRDGVFPTAALHKFRALAQLIEQLLEKGGIFLIFRTGAVNVRFENGHGFDVPLHNSVKETTVPHELKVL